MKTLLLLLLACCCLTQIALASPPEIGIATFYGDNFHGRQTASKEIHDKNELTAAHRTLPYGTMVRVTVLSTGTSVDVRINDRGPFVKGRIIIVSRKAAETLGILKETDPQVKIEVIKRADEAPTPVVSDAAPTPAPATISNPSTEPIAKTETPIAGDLKARNGKELPKQVDPANTDAKKAADAEAKKIADAKKAADAAAKTAADKKAADAAAKTAADKKAADAAAKTAAKANDTGKTAPKVSPAPAPANEPKANEPIVASRSLKSAATNPNGNKTANTKEPSPAAATKEPNLAHSNLYKVQVLKIEEKGFGVQLGGFSDYNVVLQQLEQLQAKDIKGGMVYNDVLNGKPYYKLIVGPFFTKQEAQDYCNATIRGKHKLKDAFVVDIEVLAKKAHAAASTPGTAAAPAPVTPAKGK